MNKIKRDWYVSDRLFLNEYPDYGPYALIRATKTYQAPALSYYTSEMICAKIAAAVAYYESMETEKPPAFLAFSMYAAQEFVDRAADTINAGLTDKI